MIKLVLQVFTFLLIASLLSCSSSVEPIVIDNEEVIIEPEVWEIITIPNTSQRPGDVEKGKQYLFSGDYMSSGIPYNVYIAVYGQDNQNLLERTGDNAVVRYDYTAVNANGVRVVSPNCLSCHAAKINDQFIVGLGNHSVDLTINRAIVEPILSAGIIQAYGADSPELEAYQNFSKGLKAIGPKTQTATIGVNSANKITEVLISHRDKNTLEWNDTPYINLSNEVIPADVPAWWLLKKKNAMFYTALGRNDFCKSFIGAALLSLKDVEKAKEIDENMPDVLAYFKSLESPKYPFEIDNTLANTGKSIFENTCSSCHGTYGENPQYPNSLVALKTVKTDPELSNHYTAISAENTYFYDWFNTGYLGTQPNGILYKAEGGYIAPPLDGIWATAPYFHNASVPTIMEVLNSKTRPKLWSRNFIDTNYNKTKIGWNYTIENSKSNTRTYDTSLKGYGNGGHTFGDNLTDAERLAVLEYLKTL